jgi:hypothetical protein
MLDLSGILRIPALLLAFLLAALPTAESAAQAFTPEPGTLLRKALMDAVRLDDFYPTPELARSNPSGIQFKVNFLRVNGEWALTHVLPLQNGKDFAEPRWVMLQKKGGSWRSVDHLEPIRKYYNDDGEFFGALDMNAKAVARLKKEMPEVPADIYPH